MNKGNQKGITLIALIITIIVMLILVAVAVNTAVSSGLFGHAKNATNQWAAEQEREIGMENELATLIDKYTPDYYVGTDEDDKIVLKNRKTNQSTDFQRAYIKYANESIDLTTYIHTDYDYPYIISSEIAYALVDLGKVENVSDLSNTEQEITLVKDGISYTGNVLLLLQGGQQENNPPRPGNVQGPPMQGSEEEPSN